MPTRPAFLRDMDTDGSHDPDSEDFAPETEALLRLLIFDIEEEDVAVDILRSVPSFASDELYHQALDTDAWERLAETIPLLRGKKSDAVRRYLLEIFDVAQRGPDPAMFRARRRGIRARIRRAVPALVGGVYGVTRLHILHRFPGELDNLDAYIDRLVGMFRGVEVRPPVASPTFDDLTLAAAFFLAACDPAALPPEWRALTLQRLEADPAWIQLVLECYSQHNEAAAPGSRISDAFPRLCAAWDVNSVEDLLEEMKLFLCDAAPAAPDVPAPDVVRDFVDFMHAPANDEGAEDEGTFVPGRLTVLQRKTHAQRVALLGHVQDAASWEALTGAWILDEITRHAFAQPKGGGGWVVAPEDVEWSHVRDYLVQMLMLAGTMSQTVQM